METLRRARRSTPILLPLLAAATLPGCILLDLGSGDDAPPPYRPPTGEAPPIEREGPPIRFQGRVVDAHTGLALPAAEASAALEVLGPCGPAFQWQGWPLALRADGAFGPVEYPPPEGNGRLVFRARLPEYEDAEASFNASSLTGVPSVDLALALRPLVDVRGNATPRAVVALVEASGAAAARVAVADGDGAFALPRLPAGSYHAVAALPGLAPARVPARVAPGGAPLELPRLETVAVAGVEGNLTVGAAPAAGATLVLHNGTVPVSASIADGEGRFSIPAPSPGEHRLRIEPRSGREAEPRWVAVVAPATGLALRLAASPC